MVGLLFYSLSLQENVVVKKGCFMLKKELAYQTKEASFSWAQAYIFKYAFKSGK
jgi:hypothetical protein